MTSTRRAELQQTGELQSGELRKNLLNKSRFFEEVLLCNSPSSKKKAITKQF